MDARIPWTRPIRAMLFVPGNRPNWIEKARGSGADALVLDLEDSVVPAAKAEARRISAAAIAGSAEGGPAVYVRTNKSVHIYDFDDIQAVVRPGLSGIFVTKADGPEDIALISRMIAEIEHRRSMTIGAVGLVVAIETARAAQFAFEIASHPRVDALVACAARNADVARNLGFSWTPEGLETLYHRSRAIMACRAAGKRFPIGGLWQDVHDLAGLRAAAAFNRQLGFRGEIVLHPSNVPVVNEVYSLGDQERAHYRAMIAAFEAAEKDGRAALMFDGEHIDIAHVETARDILKTSESER
jgi:citrate lyase subunit beta/citryl-CoA lyase